MPDGYGFLRSIDGNFANSSSDTYVSSTQIKKFALRNGDVITGQVRQPKDQENITLYLKLRQLTISRLKRRKKDLFLIT